MGKLLTDETGLKIVEALKNTETTKQRIAEINASAESAKQSALNEIQEVKDTIPADYSVLNYEMLMLMSSLKKTATGNGIVNITNTAENGILKVTSNGSVTVKNQNMFEDILTDGVDTYNCNVSYDNVTGKYTVEYTGAENGRFNFGILRDAGKSYVIGCGKKQKYNKNLSIRVNCDEVTRNAFYITYFDSSGVSLGVTEPKRSNTIYKIDDVEGAEFFVITISFDYNPGLFTTGDIFHFSLQIEYGDTVSDFVLPCSNTDNLAYEGTTNIVGDGDITVEYVPSLNNLYDK